MQNRFIDLYSDTKTKPSPGMRKAMAEAEVGDEQKYEDPTVERLRERICEILGKEDAVFMPSGTMCNQASIRDVIPFPQLRPEKAAGETDDSAKPGAAAPGTK